MEPLKSDSKRQAIPPLRGYSYQIWQSVFRWLELKENQQLFLEGAEDIDLLGPNEAETVQVKETAESGAVTLRSKDVIESLNHFWEHRLNNPQISITFRFLTTSERGFEQGNPFNNTRGLDLWDSCKYPGTDVSALLLSLNNLSKDLRAFITDSTEKDFREKLILPIEWDTANKTQTFIEEAVERKIVEYGNRVSNLSPSESKVVVPQLLRYVWDVVLKKDNRRLTTYDFLKLFEEATMELVSKQKLRGLERIASNLSNPQANIFAANSTAAAFGTQWKNEAVLEPFAPPEMTHFLGRDELVSELNAKLNRAGIVVLNGSTGMGKSVLSYQLATSTPGKWRKIDLSGCTPEQIKDRLNFAARLIEDDSEQIDCIIDDLNFDKRAKVYENDLAKLVFALKIRNGRIVITSHNSLPVRIVNLYDIDKEASVNVPYLSEVEIKTLLTKYGCPDGHKLKAWSRIISIKTSGHPLLAHTQIRNLANKNWTAPITSDSILTNDAKDVKQEFRQTLRDELSNEDRSLLYRLTIFTNRFKRKQALDLGSHSPALTLPGEIFDSLIGPWIEPVDSQYFRLSPLLNGSASEIFSEAEVKALHQAAAESFLEKVIGIVELNGLLFHGLFGEAIMPLVGATMGVLTIGESDWGAVCQVIGWFGRVHISGEKKVFPENNFANFLLRRLQFKIMAEIEPQQAVKIAEILEREWREWDGSDAYPGTKNGMFFAFLSEALFDMDVPFSIGQIADWTLEILPLSKNTNAIFPNHPEHQKTLEEKIKPFSNTGIYARAATGRCKSAEDVVELLTAFDKSTAEAAQEIWDAYKSDDYLAGTLVDDIWLSESRNASPDWNKCLEIFDWVVELSLRRDAKALGSAAYQAKSIVYKEYLNNTEKAVETLEEGAGKFGDSQIFLRDYRARIFYLDERYAEALDIWRQILPSVIEDRNSARTFSFRDAEICAAKLGYWREAADLALAGEETARLPWIDNQPVEISRNVLSEVTAVGFRTDYAFAIWKDGDKATAVKEFSSILGSFKDFPSPETDVKVNMLYKRVGHTIGWFLSDEKEDIVFSEPPPACFSSPEVIEELKDSPIQPIIKLWYLLARLEYKLKLGDSVFERLESEYEKSDFPEIKNQT